MTASSASSASPASPRHNAGHSTYMADQVGRATISPTGAFEAGSMQAFELVYTAGYFGIDDTGSLKIVHRFASDMGKPQFSDPAGWNHVTAEASNGAVLELNYDQKGNLRPWDKTLRIRVLRGFLREEDTITVRFGDPRGGSPGMRVQTFAEPTFEFKVLVDPFATYNFIELPEQPTIAVVAGPPVAWKAVLPTLRRRGDAFSLGFKGEDKWGNPTEQVRGRYRLRASLPVSGLPEGFTLDGSETAWRLDGLRAQACGDLVIEVLDEGGQPLCASNPLRIVEQATHLPYWADLHGQSEETIGTNSARELITFARDCAFLDAMSHQGNDFQITGPFWDELNRLSAEFNEDGRFVIFPGWEWSGNTGLGGDRNVLMLHEGRAIRRSHHGLIEDLSDAHTDAHSAADLFRALEGEDCLVFAHIGGRYADISQSHDGRLERSIEIHSDWGTFEWLLDDALAHGYRVGILANSDGHKGRHGASHPGASLFGAYGGLSCLLATELSRKGLAEALRRRHHYATTGSRVLLDVKVALPADAQRCEEDPQLGPTTSHPVREARMGDIVRCTADRVDLSFEVSAAAPIERVEVRNRMAVLQTLRPYGPADLGRRIRVIWQGSEYRGRGRQTVWDGSLRLSGNRIEAARPINLWNLDKPLVRDGDDGLSWRALTTGGFGGAELDLADAHAGQLRIDTKLVQAELPVAEIGLDDTVLETDGGIARRLRLFRLPDNNDTCQMSATVSVPLHTGQDNALLVCVTFEDGHVAWSSPIYLIA